MLEDIIVMEHVIKKMIGLISELEILGSDMDASTHIDTNMNKKGDVP